MLLHKYETLKWEKYFLTEVVTNIGELWDLDATFEELHLSGSLEELPEATGEEAAENGRIHEIK